MAKELPYFKFEPNAWENGNIQMLSREDKGLFIDLCALYWSRLGEVPEKLAIQKLCGGNAVALKPLYEIEAANLVDGQICIDFLNEQLLEFEDTSKTNSENAKKGWEKRRLSKTSSDRNATALNPQSESYAIREEKRKEEKIKENDIESRKLKFASTLEPFVLKYGRDSIKAFYLYWTEPNKSNTKFKQELEKTWSLERRLTTWIDNESKFNLNKPQQQKPTPTKKTANLAQLRAEEEAYLKSIQNEKQRT